MIFSLSFSSCIKEPKYKSFVGVWKAQDGAIIELNSDGKYSAQKIDFSKIKDTRPEFLSKRLNFEGEWHLNSKKRIIELESESRFKDHGIENTYLYNGEKMSHKVGISFNIEGSGLFQNKPPWFLVVFIGDPDDLNKYTFTKEEI